jgi:predicted molibdopterin-dependent oxidoreductase YjgC
MKAHGETIRLHLHARGVNVFRYGGSMSNPLFPTRVIPTTCPYCGVGCQINLHLHDHLIYKVTGQFENEVNHGNLCVKGRFGYDFVHAPDRLTEPLMRVKGALRPTTWDTALTHVVQRLSAIRAQHGPEAIGFLVSAKCTNEENYLLQKMARGLIGTHNVDHCARL